MVLIEEGQTNPSPKDHNQHQQDRPTSEVDQGPRGASLPFLMTPQDLPLPIIGDYLIRREPGVCFAFGSGFIHGDPHPGNIFVQPGAKARARGLFLNLTHAPGCCCF